MEVGLKMVGEVLHVAVGQLAADGGAVSEAVVEADVLEVEQVRTKSQCVSLDMIWHVGGT